MWSLKGNNWKRAILKMKKLQNWHIWKGKELKKYKSGKEQSEKGQLWYEKMKKDKSEKDQSEK